jgi:hypothetical protein
MYQDVVYQAVLRLDSYRWRTLYIESVEGKAFAVLLSLGDYPVSALTGVELPIEGLLE